MISLMWYRWIDGKGSGTLKENLKWNIEERFCEYLEKYHKGSANPVSSKTLEAVFYLKGTEIRRLVNALRCKGKPICSDYYGYYYAADQHEVNGTVAQLNSRIHQMSKARDGLEGCTEYLA